MKALYLFIKPFSTYRLSQRGIMNNTSRYKWKYSILLIIPFLVGVNRGEGVDQSPLNDGNPPVEIKNPVVNDVPEAISLADYVAQSNKEGLRGRCAVYGLKDPSATLGLQDIPDDGMRANYIKDLCAKHYGKELADRVYVKETNDRFRKQSGGMPMLTVALYRSKWESQESIYVFFLTSYFDVLTTVERNFVLLHEMERIVQGHMALSHICTKQDDLDEDWGAIERMGSNKGAIDFFSRPEVITLHEGVIAKATEEKKLDLVLHPTERIAAAQKFQQQTMSQIEPGDEIILEEKQKKLQVLDYSVEIKDPNATLGLQDLPGNGVREKYIRKLYKKHNYPFADSLYIKKGRYTQIGCRHSRGSEGEVFVLFIDQKMDCLTPLATDFVLLHEAEHIAKGHFAAGRIGGRAEEFAADWGAMQRMNTNKGAIEFFSDEAVNNDYAYLKDNGLLRGHHPSHQERLAAAQKFQPMNELSN
jgi:hypothetical protein